MHIVLDYAYVWREVAITYIPAHMFFLFAPPPSFALSSRQVKDLCCSSGLKQIPVQEGGNDVPRIGEGVFFSLLFGFVV